MTTYKEEAVEAARRRFSSVGTPLKSHIIEEVLSSAEPFIREAARKEVEDRLREAIEERHRFAEWFRGRGEEASADKELLAAAAIGNTLNHIGESDPIAKVNSQIDDPKDPSWDAIRAADKARAALASQEVDHV
jgi:hypothetical protein